MSKRDIKDLEKAKQILINLYLTVKIRRAEEVNKINLTKNLYIKKYRPNKYLTALYKKKSSC